MTESAPRQVHGTAPYDLVLRARSAVVDGTQRSAAVAIRAGRIVDVGPLEAPWTAVEEVRLDGDEVLMPGLVDTHVHINEPGRTEWEGFASATRAALRGGITTLVDMPLNSMPPTTDVAALTVKREAAAGQCYVDVGFWGGAVPGNRDQLADLHTAGVFGFKCFLIDSGVAEFPPLTPDQLEQHLAALAPLDALMLVHAEDAGAMADAPVSGGRRYRDFLDSRPQAGEDAAVAHVIAATRATGCRSHIVHLSSGAALSRLRTARAEGLPVTAETCPHYLSFAAESILDGATAYKCCPPIRDERNREELWRGLAEGVLDCVVSDHSPSLPELKDLDGGDFAKAWGGVASLQISLPAVWTEAARRGHSLADVVRWMAEGPARLARLERKGRIARGYDADFAVFAPGEAFLVDPSRLEHRHPVSPYTGRRLTGVVRSTWLRGRRVTTDQPFGQLLSRAPSEAVPSVIGKESP